MNGSTTIPFRIAVLVATFRRPEGLRALIESLDRQQVLGPDGAPMLDIRIIVIDNDANAPLRDQGHDPAQWTRFPLHYAVEAERGVVAVRNRALDLVPEGMDFVAFIDDDEVASPGWLAALLATAKTHGALVVQGPVEPAYALAPPVWVQQCGLYRLGPYRDGEKLAFAATNNSLVSKPAIDRLGLRFDTRFGLSGGEDQDFFSRLLAHHPGSIVASAEARVTDTIPAHRMTMRWALRRSFRMGNSLGRIARYRLGAFGALARGIKAFARMARGLIITIIFAPLGRDRGRRGLFDIAWGAGSILGLAGVTFLEYAAKAGAGNTGAPRVRVEDGVKQ